MPTENVKAFGFVLFVACCIFHFRAPSFFLVNLTVVVLFAAPKCLGDAAQKQNEVGAVEIKTRWHTDKEACDLSRVCSIYS